MAQNRRTSIASGSGTNQLPSAVRGSRVADYSLQQGNPCYASCISKHHRRCVWTRQTYEQPRASFTQGKTKTQDAGSQAGLRLLKAPTRHTQGPPIHGMDSLPSTRHAAPSHLPCVQPTDAAGDDDAMLRGLLHIHRESGGKCRCRRPRSSRSSRIQRAAAAAAAKQWTLRNAGYSSTRIQRAAAAAAAKQWTLHNGGYSGSGCISTTTTTIITTTAANYAYAKSIRKRKIEHLRTRFIRYVTYASQSMHTNARLFILDKCNDARSAWLARAAMIKIYRYISGYISSRLMFQVEGFLYATALSIHIHTARIGSADLESQRCSARRTKSPCADAAINIAHTLKRNVV
ncbi:unnamed protein product [Trichogramma brassicae]|uniref:Uncharacterized protein n=1 Tax=Trichogramma brassicae TaxID=86971 RepID=A0A6H5IVP0_9HYME|nr:unnamed protein product [Trichogramma brassicae]